VVVVYWRILRCDRSFLSHQVWYYAKLLAAPFVGSVAGGVLAFGLIQSKLIPEAAKHSVVLASSINIYRRDVIATGEMKETARMVRPIILCGVDKEIVHSKATDLASRSSLEGLPLRRMSHKLTSIPAKQSEFSSVNDNVECRCHRGLNVCI
jgi:hypothetical protein